jgi:hypothetical protein
MIRGGGKYYYDPVGIDRTDPPVGVQRGVLSPGDTVRVIPPKSLGPWQHSMIAMGHCYIESEGGEFAGLVAVDSLRRDNDNR